MRIDNRQILVAIVLTTLLLFALVAFTTGPARIALGLLCVLFSPGYVLLSVLFPRQGDLGGIERVALSFGLSVGVVPLIGFIVNYSPWGIRLYPILICTSLFIMITAAIGWYQQRKLPAVDRLHFDSTIRLPKCLAMTKLDKTLSISLIIGILGAVGFLGYVIVTPKEGEKFTEFYILNMEGEAQDYPRQVILGEPIEIIIGVVNHEYQRVSYRVYINVDGVTNDQVVIGTLDHEEKREKRVAITPQVAGEKSRVEFHLYENGEDTPYFQDPLHLYIDVYQ